MSTTPGDALPQIPFTERYVVPPDGRRRLAWASVRFTLFAARSQRLFYGTIVAFALVVRTLEGWSPFGQALLQLVGLVAIGLALSVLWACTAGFAQTFHSTRYRFAEGAVHESGFGDEGFVLRGPTGEVHVPFAGLRRVRAHGDFVYMALDGLGGQAIFPRALFPDDEIDRINAA